MKLLSVICLLGMVACAHDRNPASLDGQPIAQDSAALGNVMASAVKRTEQQNVCFDIHLAMKGVSKEDAQASNWSVAWVDKNDQYHLMNLGQRNPASGGQVVVPYGAYQEWNNNFQTCAQGVRMEDVKSLVLTPKELPYKDAKGLNLQWK